jgi:hypothetical protein
MAKPSSPIFKVSGLYQVGIVVRDLERSMEQYSKVLGIDKWGTLYCDPSNTRDMTYHGNPVEYRFKVAFAKVGYIELELIQPLEGDNIYSDFLKEHGEGLHHLGHLRVKNLNEAVRAWEKAGFSCLQSGRVPEGTYAYIDTVKALGVILELFEFTKEVS